METGEAPRQMIDPNTKTDYAKMKRLVSLDRLDGDRKGVVRTIAEQGYIDTTIETTFPAIEMINPNMFVSLLFYYGMLTIGGTALDKLHLVVPNLNVWEQYYRFLFDQYQDTARIDMMKLENAFTDAALKGIWQPLFQYLSDRYFEDSSVRDAIGGEKNVQGYFMAYLNLSRLFVIRPELEFFGEEIDDACAEVVAQRNSTEYHGATHGNLALAHDECASHDFRHDISASDGEQRHGIHGVEHRRVVVNVALVNGAFYRGKRNFVVAVVENHTQARGLLLAVAENV